MPAVQPEELLKDLEKVWAGLGKQDDAGQGVLRACAMTFLVVTEAGSASGSNIGETLAALMPEHPSRAVVVVLDPRAADISARVFAQCWMPFGRRQQICCEQIEITTPRDRLRDIATVILGLIVPDLPVVMWSRCPSLFELPEYNRLLPLIDKLIVDSAAVPDPAAFLRRLRAMPDLLVADLDWTRLTRWRETVASVFENPEFLEKLPSIRRVTVSYGGSRPPTRALYLAAWLAQCTGGKVPPVLRAEESHAGVTGLELQADGLTVSLHLAGGSQAELHAGSLVSLLSFERPNDYLVLREELTILGRDPAFDNAFAGAIALSAQ